MVMDLKRLSGDTPIVLTGAGGMLGSAFRARLDGAGLICLSRAELQSADRDALRRRLLALRPRLVINAAADTDVEASESDPQRATAANVELPRTLAAICHEIDATIVHFSSTGCYGDYQSTPYRDGDRLQPTTVHHRAKAEGDAAVRAAHEHNLILRLGWLYGGTAATRKNFVWQRIVEARGKPEMFSDPYQTGCPSWVGDVVTQTLALLDAKVYGTFNCVAGGATSRFEYVRRILTQAGLDTRLTPARFQRQAPVSCNEAAENDGLERIGLNLMPPWEDALDRYIDQLLASEQTT